MDWFNKIWENKNDISRRGHILLEGGDDDDHEITEGEKKRMEWWDMVVWWRTRCNYFCELCPKQDRCFEMMLKADKMVARV